MIRRFFCFFGLHAPPPGVTRAWSIRWACHGCGTIRPGHLSTARRSTSSWHHGSSR